MQVLYLIPGACRRLIKISRPDRHLTRQALMYCGQSAFTSRVSILWVWSGRWIQFHGSYRQSLSPDCISAVSNQYLYTWHCCHSDPAPVEFINLSTLLIPLGSPVLVSIILPTLSSSRESSSDIIHPTSYIALSRLIPTYHKYIICFHNVIVITNKNTQDRTHYLHQGPFFSHSID